MPKTKEFLSSADDLSSSDEAVNIFNFKKLIFF